MSQARIGISGWTYAGWRGSFYPQGLPHRRELEYASQRMNAIEINGTFYSLQRPSSFLAWRRETPRGFVFAVKGSRFITHMTKLNNVEAPLANFFAQGVLLLEEKLGPILWQFGPNWSFNEDRFRRFFDLLPRDTESAAALAKRHDDRLTGRAWTEIDVNRPIRHAVEIRHPSFNSDRFVDLCREHGVALVFADTAGRWPYTEDLTADFVYVRLHGSTDLYASGYTDAELAWWTERIDAWRCGCEPADARRASPRPCHPATERDVYVFFDNDAKVRAPFDAIRLARAVREREQRAA